MSTASNHKRRRFIILHELESSMTKPQQPSGIKSPENDNTSPEEDGKNDDLLAGFWPSDLYLNEERRKED